MVRVVEKTTPPPKYPDGLAHCLSNSIKISDGVTYVLPKNKKGYTEMA